MFTCEVGGSKATAVILSICLSLVGMAAQAAEPDHFRKYIYPAEGFEAAFPSKPLEFRTENKGNPGVFQHIPSSYCESDVAVLRVRQSLARKSVSK